MHCSNRAMLNLGKPGMEQVRDSRFQTLFIGCWFKGFNRPDEFEGVNPMNKFGFLLLLLCGFFSFSPEGIAYYIKGSLDACHLDHGHYCYAWACISEYPDRLIVLRLSIDDGLMFSSSSLSNYYREDAVKEECGKNRYRGAFFDLDRAIIDHLSDGNPHEIALEALDPETNRYISMMSRVIQGNPVRSIVLFKQSPHQGIIINTKSINDINSLPKGVFGVANWDEANATVEFAEMTRVYLNSREYQRPNSDVTFLRNSPFYIFPEKINPWVLGRKLSVSISLAVDSAERWQDGEVYVVMYTLWSDDKGHKFWLGWQLFDLRVVGEFVAMDDCKTCTGWPIVAGHADGGIYGQRAVDSAHFIGFLKDSGPVKFTVLVTWENFMNSVSALRQIQGLTGYPGDPLRYELESIWLNPEVYVGTPTAGGILDIRFFDFSVGVQ